MLGSSVGSHGHRVVGAVAPVSVYNNSYVNMNSGSSIVEESSSGEEVVVAVIDYDEEESDGSS